MTERERLPPTVRTSRSSTTTSTAIPGQSRDTYSESRPMAEAVTQSELDSNQPRQYSAQSGFRWDTTLVVALLSMVVAAIVGYFSGIYATKEDIASLRVQAQKLLSETESLRRDVDSLEKSRESENVNARLSGLEALSRSSQMHNTTSR